jgi:glycosyltransferase involved in cell wall biosynthesis
MKLLGIPERKITTIYNGVSSDLAAVTPEKIKSLRETLQIEEGVSVVGMLSRYSWHKDFPVFFRAAAIVRKKHPRVCFLTAGGGPLQEYRQMLEKMDPGSPIKMLGFQSAPEVLLSILNILCLSTKQEGCSNVILEAMAGGIPVVATAVGGNPELVEEGVTGLLAPPEDAPSLAERILRLLENPGLARQMAEAGKNKAKTYFSCEKMVASYQGLYERLCAQHLHLS